jgi:GTPase SAR1 family protein
MLWKCVCRNFIIIMVLRKTDVRVFKIIVIGDSSVGKTCLTFRFCCGKFPVKTEVTIGVDFREKCVDIDDETIKVCELYFINLCMSD